MKLSILDPSIEIVSDIHNYTLTKHDGHHYVDIFVPISPQVAFTLLPVKSIHFSLINERISIIGKGVIDSLEYNSHTEILSLSIQLTTFPTISNPQCVLE